MDAVEFKYDNEYDCGYEFDNVGGEANDRRVHDADDDVGHNHDNSDHVADSDQYTFDLGNAEQAVNHTAGDDGDGQGRR